MKTPLRVSYYPGCTLKADARHFEESAILSFRELGIELVELGRWNCCGTVFSFTTDNVIYHLAPVRNLLRVRELGYEVLITLCSMCFNTLKRANALFNEDEVRRDKIINIMYKENLQYDGKTRVVHALELLRDSVGFDTLRQKAVPGLNGLKLAAYYGCMLLRPEGIGIDDPENPSIFEEALQAMGADVVEFPLRNECCGAYQTAQEPEITAARTFSIVQSARSTGADAIVVSCPLCGFNLDQRQALTEKMYKNFECMPIFYFTECLALSLGTVYPDSWKELHHVTVDPILQKLQNARCTTTGTT